MIRNEIARLASIETLTVGMHSTRLGKVLSDMACARDHPRPRDDGAVRGKYGMHGAVLRLA